MSEENVDWNKAESIKILTVGRLTEQKGIDNGILVCKELINKGYKVKWYVVGTGDDKEKLTKLIKEKNLEEIFILLGAKTNPYKYMKGCDIYVQPSRFEGYGITVAVAKALRKPIVATNIPEFQEQIINEKTGLLVNNNKEMVKAIEELINRKDLKNALINNLNNDKNNVNESELGKLYEIIDR